MIINLLKHSLRALKRQKSFVFINVGGLAIGIACTMIITLFITYQLSFDNYHEKKDQIYQLALHGIIGGEEFKGAYTAAPIGPSMKEEIPEVLDFLRINGFSETVIRHEDNFFVEDHFVEADSSFFHFFSIPLLRGESHRVLSEPFSVVISQSTAEKMFGNQDPMDQLIKVGTYNQMHRITGIMADVPENTHFKAGMVGSFTTNESSRSTNWLSNSFATYVMLHPQADPQKVEEALMDLVVQYVGPLLRQFLGISLEDFAAQGNHYSIFLLPLTQINIEPGIEQSLGHPKDPRYLKIFAAIGLLIILIAIINFMNLATAQATKRAREVGVKKVSGSTQGLLVGQFLTETIILALLAMAGAILIAEISLPYINNLLDLNLYISYTQSWYTLPLLLLFTVVTGVLAGIYPAFYLSSFNPVKVLKGSRNGTGSRIGLRRVLTTLQFSISIVLIVGTLIMHRQIRYMLNKDLGFDKEHVLVIRRASVLADKVESFKNELLTLGGVQFVSASTAVPGYANNNNGHTIAGRPDESFVLQTTWVDYDFFDTYGITLYDGRFFDPELITDRQACLINHRAVRNFNIADPFSIRFNDGNEASEQMPVIGVVNDFHFESLRFDIRPSIFKFKHEHMNWGYVSVRLAPGNTSQMIEQIEQKWHSFTQQEPMLYFFMDKDFERLYREEKQSAALSVIFTILAIVIASLGLYGLTMFTISQKTKEIGIRKTFGASITDIWFMVAREILLLIVISTAVAWPVIYWVAQNWLQSYHYRITLSPAEFLLGLLISSLVAMITISYRALKAARLNPSISLRYE